MKALISSCLLGRNIKYSGGNNLTPKLVQILKKYNVELVEVCPEAFGGLSIPREPAEIINGKVLNRVGKDVSLEFEEGAQKTLNLAIKNEVDFVILKERSPSCGSNYIYDGSFSGKIIPGKGWSAKKLFENNIKIFSEEELKEIEEFIKNFNCGN